MEVRSQNSYFDLWKAVDFCSRVKTPHYVL